MCLLDYLLPLCHKFLHCVGARSNAQTVIESFLAAHIFHPPIKQTICYMFYYTDHKLLFVKKMMMRMLENLAENLPET